QPATLHAAREVAAARIKSAKRDKKTIGGKITVTTENPVQAFPEIGNNNDIRLVVTGACFDPRLPFAHFIGSSQIGVPIGSPDLQAAELVNQEEIDHTCDRVGSVYGRSAILQDVHVVDH